jgi:hypothetical protein
MKPISYLQKIIKWQRKNWLTLLFITPSLLSFGQYNSSLRDLLWNSVNDCYSLIEDMNEDGFLDGDVIEDINNGYLKVSGGWPPCGCLCTSIAGAYKNEEGKYIILQYFESVCNWNKRISSNKNLYDILPPNFGINDYTLQPVSWKIRSPIFFVNIEIPNHGTDTRVSLELVPFGLYPDGNEPLCFEYSELYKEDNYYSNFESLTVIADIAKAIQEGKTLDYILSREFEKISPNDKKIIDEIISENFYFQNILDRKLKELKEIYDTYSQLETTELILGWDIKNSRFYIKKKGKKLIIPSFKDFLAKNEYWSMRC